MRRKRRASERWYHRLMFWQMILLPPIPSWGRSSKDTKKGRQKKTPGSLVYKIVSQVPKRIRFVISSAIMTLLLLLTTFFGFQYVWIFLPVLLVMAYLTTYLAVLDGIDGAEWIVLFIVPVLFTGFMYAFYFLFPVRWLTRVPLIVLYGVSFYSILLTTNIFNVGVDRNIQLYRAAFSVNFLFQTFVMFLAAQVLLSFRQGPLINTLGAALISFPIALQLFWSVTLKENISRNVVIYAALTALILGQIALFLSFIPLRSTMIALFMTAAYYSVTGLLYHYLDEKLFRQTIREYAFVMIFVSIIVLLTVQW